MRGERSGDANLNLAAHLGFCFNTETEAYYGGSGWGGQPIDQVLENLFAHTVFEWILHFPSNSLTPVLLEEFAVSWSLMVYRLNREQKVKALDRVTKAYILFLKLPRHV